MCTEPWFGRCRPVMTLNSVVLPAPFGPIRPVISPAWARSDTSANAATPPKFTLTCRTSRAHGDPGAPGAGGCVAGAGPASGMGDLAVDQQRRRLCLGVAERQCEALPQPLQAQDPVVAPGQ